MKRLNSNADMKRLNSNADMKRLNSNADTMDRLSELPDSIVHDILAFLNMKDVVRTTLISKRWKYRWITLHCLKFEEFNKDSVRIRNFVSRALTLWGGLYLRNFSLCFCGGYELEASFSRDMNLWLLFATQRKVEELSIELSLGDCDRLYCLPRCLYDCSSIRKLSLICCNLEIRGNVQWDRLNSLVISLSLFSEDVINKVLSSSPQLETLTLSCLKGLRKLSIRSSSLKKLHISVPKMMTIWAPNLEALKLSGRQCRKCLLTDVSSLTEVHLDFEGFWSARNGEILCQILPAIQHVVKVELSYDCFQMFKHMKGKHPFSPLLNVKLLKIGGGLTEFSELDWLLEIFPKLKVLSIEWKLYPQSVIGRPSKFNAENYRLSQVNILKSNLLQLRTVKISGQTYEASIFQFVEFLLKHATMIEKVVIRIEEAVDSEDMWLASQKGSSLQRSFPGVELTLLQ